MTRLLWPSYCLPSISTHVCLRHVWHMTSSLLLFFLSPLITTTITHSPLRYLGAYSSFTHNQLRCNSLLHNGPSVSQCYCSTCEHCLPSRFLQSFPFTSFQVTHHISLPIHLLSARLWVLYHLWATSLFLCSVTVSAFLEYFPVY